MQKHFSSVKRWIATALLSLLAITFVWQGMFIADNTAMADTANRIENKVDRDIERTKDFVDDTKQQVKKTANRNESKVDRNTDNNSFLENKADKDADRIEKRANEDAANTKEALDETQNVIESTIDNVKEIFK